MNLFVCVCICFFPCSFQCFDTSNVNTRVVVLWSIWTHTNIKFIYTNYHYMLRVCVCIVYHQALYGKYQLVLCVHCTDCVASQYLNQTCLFVCARLCLYHFYLLWSVLLFCVRFVAVCVCVCLCRCECMCVLRMLFFYFIQLCLFGCECETYVSIW